METAELKATRDSILSARMGDWLQLPKEEAWLRNTMNTLGAGIDQRLDDHSRYCRSTNKG